MALADAAGSNLSTFITAAGLRYLYDPVNELPNIAPGGTIHISGTGWTTGDYAVTTYFGSYDVSSQGGPTGLHNLLLLADAAIPVTPFPANASKLTGGAWVTGRGAGITCVNKAVWVGDSITAGYLSSNPPTTSHPNIDAATLPTSWTFDNLGISGLTAGGTGGMLQNFPTLTGRQLAQATAHKIMFILGGVNDFNNSGTTVADVQTALSGLVTAGKNAGAVTVLGTVLHENPAWNGGVGATVNTNIDTLNTWIRAGSSGADYVADYFARPNLSNPVNTTYFADGLHPNDAGQQEMASVDAAILTSILSSFGTPATNTSGSYASVPSNEASVTPGYIPNAPTITSFSGKGTFLAPQVVLNWTAGTWGRISVQRLTVGASGAAGIYAEVGSVIASTVGDPTTVPVTYTDHSVVNGVAYKFQLIAYPN